MIPSVLPTYNRAPMAFVRGEGSWLWQEDGTRYLDLGAGIAVNALGHANPDLVAALTEQAGKLWHVSNLYRIPDSRTGKAGRSAGGQDLCRYGVFHQLRHRGG